MVERKNSILDY